MQIDGGHFQHTPSCHMLTDVSFLLCNIGDLTCIEIIGGGSYVYYKAILHSVTNNKMTLNDIHCNETCSFILKSSNIWKQLQLCEENCVQIFSFLAF